MLELGFSLSWVWKPQKDYHDPTVLLKLHGTGDEQSPGDIVQAVVHRAIDIRIIKDGVVYFCKRTTT